MNYFRLFAGMGLALFGAMVIAASVPQTINYQGRLTNASGMPINTSTQMRFVITDQQYDQASITDEPHTLPGTTWVSLANAHLVMNSEVVTNSSGSITYQSGVDYVMNYPAGQISRLSGSSIPDGGSVLVDYTYNTLPNILWSDTITVQVSNGIYNVSLGAAKPIAASVFSVANRYLEIVIGSEHLTPRQAFTSVPYCMMAQTVPDGSINTTQLADGAVTTNKIGLGQVLGSQLADHTLTYDQIADHTITSQQIQDLSINANSLALHSLGADQIQDIYVFNTGDTITGPLQCTSNLEVDGHAGIGAASRADSSSYIYANISSTNPVYGTNSSANNTSTGNAYGGYFQTTTNGTGVHTGVYADGEASSSSNVFGTNSVANNYGTGVAYGTNSTANNSSTGNAYGGYFQTTTNGTGFHYGVYADGEAASGINVYGTYSKGNNSGSGAAYGGYFTTPASGTGGHFGVEGDAVASGAASATGTYGYATNSGTGTAFGSYSTSVNSSSGNAYGGYFQAIGGGTGPHYGVYADGEGSSSSNVYGTYGYASNNSTGNAYAGYFEISSIGGSGTHYGIFSTVNSGFAAWMQGGKVHIGSAGTGNYVSGNGDLYVQNTLEADGNEWLGGDLTVWGNNIGIGTTADSNYLIKSKSSGAPAYGAYLYASTYPLYVQNTTDSSQYCYMGGTPAVVVCNAGSGTGTRYGGEFYANSSNSYAYGLYTSAYANSGGSPVYGLQAYSDSYGNGNVYGVQAYGWGDGNGVTYGGYFAANYGTGNHYGVYATANSTGTSNIAVWGNATGAATNNYGIYGYASGALTNNYGIYNAAGTKNWVNPDPEDPSKSIVYSTLEGGENGTYWRGTARLVNGKAIIKLPDHFRKVTSAKDPITVQVSPLSEESQGLAVVKKTNSEIVVVELFHGTGNYEFDYLVQGVRLGYEKYNPVIDNVDYVPFQNNQTGVDKSEFTTQEWYDQQSEGLKRIFKSNGTLDKNGKVNEQLFRQKGWEVSRTRAPKHDHGQEPQNKPGVK